MQESVKKLLICVYVLLKLFQDVYSFRFYKKKLSHRINVMFSAFRERAFICYILFSLISVKSFFVNSSTDISPSSPSLLERTETVPDSSSLSPITHI